MPGRPTAGDFEDEAPRRRGRREDHHDDFEEAEDEPVFKEVEEPPHRHQSTRKHHQKARHLAEGDEDEDEETEERPRRHKSTHKHKGKARQLEEEDDDEDDDNDEDDDEDDDRGKQLVLHPQRKKKSHGKEVTRRKKHHTSEEESMSEDEKRAKRKASMKSKARKSEMIMKAKWEPVPADEMDGYFVGFLRDLLGHHEMKIWECVEEELILRDSETGEYNIDPCFEQGSFSKKDQRRWKETVKKFKKDKHGAELLFCSAIAKGPGYGPSYGPPAAVYVPAVDKLGHTRYNPHCSFCVRYGVECAVVPVDFDPF